MHRRDVLTMMPTVTAALAVTSTAVAQPVPAGRVSLVGGLVTAPLAMAGPPSAQSTAARQPA